jgi:hypothetical protein
MRLLNTRTKVLEDFSTDIPPYAILFHTWEDAEVGFGTFNDIHFDHAVIWMGGGKFRCPVNKPCATVWDMSGLSLGVTALLLYLVSQVVKYPTGDKAQDTLLPIQAMILVTQWIDFYVLHTPEKDYYRISRPEEKKGSIKDQGWKERLKWAFDLKMTLRGIGWNWQVKNIPPTYPVQSTSYVPLHIPAQTYLTHL